VLQHSLRPSTLSRIQNNALKQDADAKAKPFRLAELFRGLTDAIYGTPLDGVNGGKKPVELSIVTRNLQREYLRNLTGMVLRGQGAPADARSLARMHLRIIDGRIGKLLNGPTGLDDTSRAHLEESRARIAKALGASMQASDS
jgi:hypothetical protein